MWIYSRCHACQYLCPGAIIGYRVWRKVWKALNEAPYLFLFVQQTHSIHRAVWHHCLSITFLVWPVSFLNVCSLICSLPVMLWKQGLESFSLPSWQVAMTPYVKIVFWQHSMFQYLFCLQHNGNGFICITVNITNHWADVKHVCCLKLLCLNLTF